MKHFKIFYFIFSAFVFAVSAGFSSIAMAQSDQDLPKALEILPAIDDKAVKTKTHEKITFDSLLKQVVSGGRVSSGFGWRDHPVLHERRFHAGVDYAVPVGTAVKAAQKGTVIFAGNMGGYGRLLVIKHNQEFKTYYGHLSKFAKNIKKGQHVEKGQLVAYTGNTGMSTGPHIHFEIRRFDKPVNPFNGKKAPDSVLVKGGHIQKIPYGHTSRNSSGRMRTVIH